MKLLAICLALFGALDLAKGHSYHFGTQCPVVEPMQGFQMDRFLGIWHVIQKTSSSSKCISYNYTRSDEPDEFAITQDSDIPILGLTALKHEYHYTGKLTVADPSVPSRMIVRFPLSIGGSASHVIFATDYENYAGVFTCQKLAIAHRVSATILSRRRDLEKVYVDKIRQKLSVFGVSPFDLSIIQQTDCPRGNNSLDVNIDPHTFTAENIGSYVKKAGAKIGEGVDWIGEQGTKVYHKIAGHSQEDKTDDFKPEQGRKSESNDVWIP